MFHPIYGFQINPGTDAPPSQYDIVHSSGSICDDQDISYLQVKTRNWLPTMAFFTMPHGTRTAMFWDFFFGMCYVVVGKHFMSSELKTTVLDTINLECHEITSRSSLELAAVCYNLDSCLGMKTKTDLGPSGMLCSCPNGPTWSRVPDLTRILTTQFYTRRDVTIPGKRLLRENSTMTNIPSVTYFSTVNSRVATDHTHDVETFRITRSAYNTNLRWSTTKYGYQLRYPRYTEPHINT